MVSIKVHALNFDVCVCKHIRIVMCNKVYSMSSPYHSALAYATSTTGHIVKTHMKHCCAQYGRQTNDSTVHFNLNYPRLLAYRRACALIGERSTSWALVNLARYLFTIRPPLLTAIWWCGPHPAGRGRGRGSLWAMGMVLASGQGSGRRCRGEDTGGAIR